MAPHSNRSKHKPLPGREPRPEEVRQYRDAAGLTQQQAADVIYTSLRNWENWEQGYGERRMPASAFELFLLRTGQYERLSPDQVRLANGAIVALPAR